VDRTAAVEVGVGLAALGTERGLLGVVEGIVESRIELGGGRIVDELGDLFLDFFEGGTV